MQLPSSLLPLPIWARNCAMTVWVCSLIMFVSEVVGFFADHFPLGMLAGSIGLIVLSTGLLLSRKKPVWGFSLMGARWEPASCVLWWVSLSWVSIANAPVFHPIMKSPESLSLRQIWARNLAVVALGISLIAFGGSITGFLTAHFPLGMLVLSVGLVLMASALVLRSKHAVAISLTSVSVVCSTASFFLGGVHR